MAEGDEEARVSYSVKELITNVQKSVDSGFSRLEGKLDNKVDRSDLVIVHTRLDEHEADIRRLKESQTEDKAAERAVDKARDRTVSWRQWTIGTGIAALLVGGELIQLLR